MLSYILPAEEKPPSGDPTQFYRPLSSATPATMTTSASASAINRHNGIRHSVYSAEEECPSENRQRGGVTRTTSFGTMMFGRHREDHHHHQLPRPGSAAPLLPLDTPRKHSNGDAGTRLFQSPPPPALPPPTSTSSLSTAVQQQQPAPVMRKPTLHTSAKVTKDDSLYSIDSDASAAASEGRKSRAINAPAKHANLKRVSFGSSKGSMVETLVYETPVQEEPELNHFAEHNGRLPAPMIPVPDTDEGREKVRVSLLGPKPFPSTPGVLLLDPIPVDIMAASPAELLTAHTDHTVPTYHTQISTDSGWDNPFRPDGDLSREADEIVELIKGGKPITPTPGQNAPALPGYERKSAELDSSTSPLLHEVGNNVRGTGNASNGNAHSTPIKPTSGNQQQQPVNEKSTATVEVSRVTAQGPGDASQVEHVTLKKKPKCKCCVVQ